MRSAVTFVVLALVCVQPAAFAQQAGENINVLPVVIPVDDNHDGYADDPDWYIKGDGFLQRQVEPTIAASTRNPDHILAFFVDYRAVDIADDIGLGESNTLLSMALTGQKIILASIGLSSPSIKIADLPPIAAAEAWIGMSRSYDGGLTWSGGFLPGAPFDTGSSVSTPIDGLEAASDPALVAGPCGKFYLAFMAFNRDGESKLVVARYQDLNLAGGGDSIVYQGMTVVDAGTNTKCSDYFIDKPDIEVDVNRFRWGDVCDDRVYVSYSTFFDQNPDGSFQSNINVAASSNGGLSFRKRTVNRIYRQNQGSALAVDPRNGHVYVFWRHFNDPDAILMSKSWSFGGWWSWPRKVNQHISMAAFDQPSVSYHDAFAVNATSPQNPGFPELAFRSNGFPTAAITDDGTIYVAWQERVDGTGRPHEYGTPRIVMVRSRNRGWYWTDINGDPNRLAVDYGLRDITGHPNTPAPGFGYLPQERWAGPQFQPRLMFSAGQLILAHVESRGRIKNYGYPGGASEYIVPGDVQTTTFITGYDRLVDFRAAMLDPDTGALLSSTQVSRYPIRADADLLDGEDLMDVAPVAYPCWPDSGEPTDPLCVRQVNRSNAPQSAAGTVAFIGDYVDVAPIQQFIYDGSKWRWATEATDVPNQGCLTAFTDNRHLLPPPGPEEWNGYQFYDPPWESVPNNLPGCTNPGSRNTNVLTSRLDTTMVLSAPTTYKELDDVRGFPFSVKNHTGESRAYHLEITEGIGGASFHRYDETVHAGDVEIFAYSSGSFTVYVNPGYPDPVKVRVSEICPPPAGLSYDCTNTVGTLTFNVDSGYDQAPSVPGPDTQAPDIDGDPFFVVAGDAGEPNPFVVNPFVVNPFVVNPFVVNPFVVNPFVVNPFVVNPFVVNPFVVNTAPEDIEAVIDTTWTISPGESNTAASYLPLINIDNAQAFLDAGYVFQLIVHKGSLYGGITGCTSVNVAQPQILGNVYQDPGAENPFVVNPFVVNPFVVNPFVVNPFVVNSAFNMAPSDNAGTKSDDGTTKAPPASNEVYVTLRAFKIAQPGGLKNGMIYKPWEDTPSLVIVPQPCDPEDPGSGCHIASVSPDLVIEDFDTTPVSASAGGTLEGFPEGGWTLYNEGLEGQEIGDATSEDGDIQHGFYICGVGYINEWPADQPLDLAPCAQLPEYFISTVSPLSLWDSESFGPVDLSIPADLGAGDYSLVFHVDDTLAVPERTETNNWVAVLLTVDGSSNDPPVIDPACLQQTYHEDPEGSISCTLATDPNEDDLTVVVVNGPGHGELGFEGARYYYGPNLNFNGTDSFTVAISDGEFNVEATVEITLLPVNDWPEAYGDEHSTSMNTPLTEDLNAFDVDGDSLEFIITGPPENGTVSLDGNTFTYSPATGYTGADAFQFIANDGFVDSNTATIYISVDPVGNTPPVAHDATYMHSDGNVIFGVLEATDADAGDVLTFALDQNQEPAGQVQITPETGEFFFFPYQELPNEPDAFGFIVSDQSGATATATVEILAFLGAPWKFIGFAPPWEPLQYSIGDHQTVDLSWYYEDLTTEDRAPSDMATPNVWISRYSTCSTVDNSPIEQWMTVPDSYDDGHNWHLIFDGANGEGCYFFAIYHPHTGQFDYEIEISDVQYQLILPVYGGGGG